MIDSEVVKILIDSGVGVISLIILYKVLQFMDKQIHQFTDTMKEHISALSEVKEALSALRNSINNSIKEINYRLDNIERRNDE